LTAAGQDNRKKDSLTTGAIESFNWYSVSTLKNYRWDELWHQPILQLMVSQTNIILF